MLAGRQALTSGLRAVFRRSQRQTWLSSYSTRWMSKDTRQWSTPLAKNLANAIEVTGPITVAAFMRQCLTSPDSGYYMSQRKVNVDQFGQKGDFVTSPEISQVFGELVGIWFVAEWMAQGRKSSGVTIVEVGPGRGTLMADMLRTIEHFQPMASSIDAIYLVEASPSLRKAQKDLLCGDAAELKEVDIGFESRCKYLNGTKIIWTEDIRFINKDADQSPFIIAHEFFDALPIHVFQTVEAPVEDLKKPRDQSKSENISATKLTTQWREMVVTPADDPDPMAPDLAKLLPEFELSVSKNATPHSLYLPEISERYKALKKVKDSVIEISPESQAYASDFAVRIGGNAKPTTQSGTSEPTPKITRAPPFLKESPSGAALIIDYGTSSSIPVNSLRGIRNHERVSPLSSPGAVDLSADVDFLALAHAALGASPNVVVHGPMDQAQWLGAMGIQERAQKLISNAKGEEQKDRIEGAWTRLTDRNVGGMGKIYKVMAILPYLEGEPTIRRPVGFGGDVTP